MLSREISVRYGESASAAFRLAAVSWSLALVAITVWLYAAISAPSLAVAQSFGVAILTVLALFLGVSLLRRPHEIGRPITLFCLGCIYFFVLDAAFLLHNVSNFDPVNVIEADTLIALFLAVSIFTHTLVRFRANWLGWIVVRRRPCLTGNICFRIAVLAVTFECVRRLAFVQFDSARLWHELLLARNGGTFRVGVANDWRVVLAPIQALFLSATLFAALAWRREISTTKKVFLVIVIALQLTILVFDTVRADLFISMLLPILVRADQDPRSVGRLLRGFLLCLPLLILLMNTMNYARAGWTSAELKKHIFEEPGEDDFFWLTKLVAYKSQYPGLLRYKAPFGFVQGLGEISQSWVTSAVPRVLWPEKPRYWEAYDETRAWYAADTIVGDLFRAGGVACVLSGAVLFGLWLSALDAVYTAQKTDGELIAYGYLAISVVALTRGALPFNTVPLLLTCLLFILSWNIWWLFSVKSWQSLPLPLREQRLSSTCYGSSRALL